MLLRFTTERVKEAGRHQPPGYFDAIMAKGRVVGDDVEIDSSDYDAIAVQFQPKGVFQQAASFAASMAEWASAGFPMVSQETLWERSCQCAVCPRWDALAGRCRQCGCRALKLQLPHESCPLGHWGPAR